MDVQISLPQLAADHALGSVFDYLESIEQEAGLITRNVSLVIVGAGGVLAKRSIICGTPKYDIEQRAWVKACISYRTHERLGFLFDSGQRHRLEPDERGLQPPLHRGGLFIQHKLGNFGIGAASASGGGEKNELLAGHAKRDFLRYLNKRH